MTAKTKILKHIWETGGGYINNQGKVYLITKLPLQGTNILVDINNMTVEHTVHKDRNVAIVRGISATRGKGYLYKILSAICIDNRLYIPINNNVVTTRLGNGCLIDTYTFMMVENYPEDKNKMSK